MLSIRPVGLPSWRVPLRQHELMPMFSDMLKSREASLIRADIQSLQQ